VRAQHRDHGGGPARGAQTRRARIARGGRWPGPIATARMFAPARAGAGRCEADRRGGLRQQRRRECRAGEQRAALAGPAADRDLLCAPFGARSNVCVATGASTRPMPSATSTPRTGRRERASAPNPSSATSAPGTTKNHGTARSSQRLDGLVVAGVRLDRVEQVRHVGVDRAQSRRNCADDGKRSSKRYARRPRDSWTAALRPFLDPSFG
jgi:hypothetical protein